ncbi:MAG: ThuA domain-containing protein [Pseudomonadota bacterium]
MAYEGEGQVTAREILLVCKGHPYERQPFYDVFEGLSSVNYTLVEQPAAQALFTPEHAQGYDAFVLYDMPGIQFSSVPGEAPALAEPSPQLMAGLNAMLDAGVGMVFLHHAIAGWPAWPEYAEIIGGRFLYLPGVVRGKACPDSGYRHKVTHTITSEGTHPILNGVPDSFEITDELYLYQVFDDVEPLLRSSHTFTQDNFYSAKAAVVDGKMFDNAGWQHKPGSNLVGWTRQVRNSRIVYLQCGDDPAAYANPHYQRLIGNAIDWVSG